MWMRAGQNNERHYGYKNHINADEAHKLVQSFAVTDAAAHDSQVFEVLLDQAVDENDKKRAVYGSVPIKALHKMSEAQVRREAARVPLEWERTSKVLSWQHIVIFRKLAK